MTDCPLTAAIAKHGITAKHQFVPFSKSRNKDSLDISLNWIVTLMINGRDFITTDYMAGSGHCPSSGKKVPAGWKRPANMFLKGIAAWECENGFEATVDFAGSGFSKKKQYAGQKDSGLSIYKYFPIEPKLADVVYALVMDSDVLNYTSFADWADNYGMSADSIKDRAIYEACLQTALTMRAGLGDAVLSELTEACADY